MSASDPAPAVACHFGFLSLWSYVGSVESRALAGRTGAAITYKPVDLLAVFAAGGGKPVKERPLQRQAHRLVEIRPVPSRRSGCRAASRATVPSR